MLEVQCDYSARALITQQNRFSSDLIRRILVGTFFGLPEIVKLFSLGRVG